MMSTTMLEKLNSLEIKNINDHDVAAMEAEIQRITNIDLYTFITDPDILAVALHADDPDRCEELADEDSIYEIMADRNEGWETLFDDDEIEEIYYAALLALEWREGDGFLYEFIDGGFFSDSVADLLEIAKSSYDYGARLTRVLLYYLWKAEEYNISDEVCEALKNFLNDFRSKYKFLNLPLPEVLFDDYSNDVDE